MYFLASLTINKDVNTLSLKQRTAGVKGQLFKEAAPFS